MAPIELEIQSDSEIESVDEVDSDSDRSSFDDDDDDDFEERQKQKGSKQVKDIASSDTQRVRAWKIFVLILLMATTSCVAAGAYYFLKKDENDDYSNSVRSARYRVAQRNHTATLPFSLVSFVLCFYSTNSLSAPFATRSGIMS